MLNLRNKFLYNTQKVWIANSGQCLHCSSTTAGLAQSVEHLTAERKVTGSIAGVRPLLRVLKITEKKKVLPLHCKKLDLCVAWMTTQNGGPISS